MSLMLLSKLLLLVSLNNDLHTKAALTGDSSPNVTHSGYLDVDKDDGSRIFYSYYEAQNWHENAPIILWLQVFLCEVQGSCIPCTYMRY